jgi:hypothetical protein
MPFDLTVVDGIICLTFNGALSSDDLWRVSDLYAKIEAESKVSPDRMADISLVDKVELDFGAVEAVAAVRRGTMLKNRVKSAILAPKPVLYGFARMFQTLNDNPQITLELFRDKESCWAWLMTGREMDLGDSQRILGQAPMPPGKFPPLQ